MFYVLQVMGSLAVEKPLAGHRLSGVIVKRDFKYHVLAASDLGSYCTLFIYY